MSKFFAQMLITIALGLSAAVGLSPDIKGEVEGKFREAEAFAHEVTRPVFDITANVDADAEASAEAFVEANTNPDLNSLVDDISSLLPNASLDGSVSAESEMDVEAESDGVSLDLENTLESVLDPGIEIGE